eukprot:jgi/Mesvir1/11274/Mv01071-RA.1
MARPEDEYEEDEDVSGESMDDEQNYEDEEDEEDEQSEGGPLGLGAGGLPRRAQADGAGDATKEWEGLQTFPVTTQTKLREVLERLRGDNMDTLTVLLVGKPGVGKSSTVNSIFAERVCPVSAYQADTNRPMMVSRRAAGFTLNIIDTPGLLEGDTVNENAIREIRQFIADKTIHAILYVDRLDNYRVESINKQIFGALTTAFGPLFWKITILLLTHGQVAAPDNIPYAEYVSKRFTALRKSVQEVVTAHGGSLDAPLPTLVVENSGRCTTNIHGEKILPSGEVWLPHVLEKLAELVTAEHHVYTVDRERLKGKNANKQGRKWIIPLLLVQVKVIYPLVRHFINKDAEL